MSNPERFTSVEARGGDHESLRGLREEEEQALESGAKSGIARKIKRALVFATAGLALGAAEMGYAREQPKEPTQQESEQTVEKRLNMRREYLSRFGVKDLRLDKPLQTVRCPCEQYGIYIKDRHLGDIYSLRTSFEGREFKNEVERVLQEAGVEPKVYLDEKDAEKTKLNINVDQAAREILKRWGGEVKGNKIDIGDPENVIRANDETASASVIGDVEHDMLILIARDKDGTIHVMTVIRGKIINYSKTPPREVRDK